MHDLTKRLVGDDIDTYEVLLSRSDLVELHAWGLAGDPSARWLARAEVALDRGWAEERIVAQCWWAERVKWGPESRALLALAEKFKVVRKTAPQRLWSLVDAGIAQYTSRAKEAVAKERREAVYGAGG